jgi:hypothetical protein
MEARSAFIGRSDEGIQLQFLANVNFTWVFIKMSIVSQKVLDFFSMVPKVIKRTQCLTIQTLIWIQIIYRQVLVNTEVSAPQQGLGSIELVTADCGVTQYNNFFMFLKLKSHFIQSLHFETQASNKVSDTNGVITHFRMSHVKQFIFNWIKGTTFFRNWVGGNFSCFLQYERLSRANKMVSWKKSHRTNTCL